MNMETLVTCPVTVDHWAELAKALVERHREETGSRRAGEILQHWESEIGKFVQVCPKEMLGKLDAPIGIENEAIPAE